MMAISLFLVFALAKLAAIWSSVPHLSPWIMLAYCWQDAAIALAFGILAVLSGHRTRRLITSLYWLLTVYAALNIFVERAVFTPLTMPMIHAAGGALADSLRLYLTPVNLLLVVITMAFAFVLPQLLRNVPAAWSATLLVVVAAGLMADAHVDTHGMDRNVVIALAGDRLPEVHAAGSYTDWRHSIDSVAADSVPNLSGSARGMNIVMISLESTAARYLALYGAKEDPTPHLTALARNAMVFENAYAVYPESIKGLYSVLCSMNPAADGEPSACDSIAAVLAHNGYRTAMFHSGRFDYLGMESAIRNRGYEKLADAREIGGSHATSFGVDEPSTVDRMLQWIDTVPSGQRFFLTYLPIAGHHPYATPGAGPFHATNDLEQYRNALYYGDQSLGALMAGLRTRGLDRNTLWVIYGDHGEAFNQHTGNYGHTFFLYEENVHVPFVIAGPGLIVGQHRMRKVVSLIDTAPTIVDLVGLAAPRGYEGRSMLDSEPRNALFFTDYSLGLLGVRDGRWKFIDGAGSRRPELYDLDTDPGELRNVAQGNAASVGRYREIVRGWSNARRGREISASVH